ncbi:MAG: hypothetical protein DDT32_02214 [Syntrophomonadaceae bacterium]|nr:hypothetical protein [Bacillota bacterium]
MTIAVTPVATVGTHEITITGTSATAVETAAFTLTVTLPAFDIHLVPGWNLISLPLIPDDPAIKAVLAGILEDVIRVWHFDAYTKQWHPFPGIPGLPPLTEMVDGKGYWINMKAAATLTVVGTEMPPPPALPPEYPLFKGWNHIGFKSITQMMAREYLDPAAMKIFLRMWGFEAGAWFPVKADTYLKPGMGYWLAVSEDGRIFPGGVLLQ